MVVSCSVPSSGVTTGRLQTFSPNPHTTTPQLGTKLFETLDEDSLAFGYLLFALS